MPLGTNEQKSKCPVNMMFDSVWSFSTFGETENGSIITQLKALGQEILTH